MGKAAKSSKASKPAKAVANLFAGLAEGKRSNARSSAAAPARGSSAEQAYTARHIEVLEGLEPVRRRP
ncbi:MAG: hypothetical protein WBE71_20160, partial [Xanthobacteraceae bacterium]